MGRRSCNDEVLGVITDHLPEGVTLQEINTCLAGKYSIGTLRKAVDRMPLVFVRDWIPCHTVYAAVYAWDSVPHEPAPHPLGEGYQRMKDRTRAGRWKRTDTVDTHTEYRPPGTEKTTLRGPWPSHK